MNLVFFGTARFAVPTLRRLAKSVSLVVTQPDRPTGRGMKLQASPIKLAAEEIGLPVVTPERARAPEFVAHIASLDADALVVAAYGQILSQALLDSAKHGGINLHGSLLPKYRGAAPIQRAILDGESETGVTLMQMDKGMDTGDMIAIEKVPIGPDDTYGELEVLLGELGAEMAERWMPRICLGDYTRTPQNHDVATLAPKVDKEEAELRFDRDAFGEYRRFRAFTPSPGAWILTSLGKIRLSECRLSDRKGLPGEVLETRRSLTIGFSDGALEFLAIQPEGKKRMAGSDFANGARLHPGRSVLPHSG
ncbi:MAG TPA: methionyl-tRNA formyltransferase [Fimbriimonadaceae bacterium]|nr:methionyl-tRNA formyltransferase [Fimbriimonadaceae bacterium]